MSLASKLVLLLNVIITCGEAYVDKNQNLANQPNYLENLSNLLMQSMKERLKRINNKGYTSKTFRKLETTNYVVNKILNNE
jgi:hypothetical protein